jgi:hypothetical protein
VLLGSRMLPVWFSKWHDLISRDSCESGFSNNWNPRHFRQRASHHLSLCRLQVTKLVKDNEWPNPLWYQLKDRGRWPEGGWKGAKSNSSTWVSLCPKFKPQSQNTARKWWTHQPTAYKWSPRTYECSGKRMRSIGQLISKIWPKQWTNVGLKLSVRHCPV